MKMRALLCLLVLSVWLATTLGLVHRTMHNPVTAHAPAALMQHAATAHGHADRSDHVHGGLAALFGDHNDAECRLYDQLSHGSAALCVPPLILPVMLPAATFAYLEGQALSRWVALFDARGPPSTR